MGARKPPHALWKRSKGSYPLSHFSSPLLFLPHLFNSDLNRHLDPRLTENRLLGSAECQGGSGGHIVLQKESPEGWDLGCSIQPPSLKPTLCGTLLALLSFVYSISIMCFHPQFSRLATRPALSQLSPPTCPSQCLTHSPGMCQGHLVKWQPSFSLVLVVWEP